MRGGVTKNKPIYWAKYNALIKHKKEGGVNIRDVKSSNKAVFKQA